MTADALPPPDEFDQDVDIATAWYRHMAAVESKLDRMAGGFSAMVEQLGQANDMTRHPDPFAHVALAAAAELHSGASVTPSRVLAAADKFEDWLRRPRPDGTP